MVSLVLVYKGAGANAVAGGALEEVAAVARKANDTCRSIGVAVALGMLPESGQASFTIDAVNVE